MISDDQRYVQQDWLSQTKHFRIIDPEGRSQPELEEGLGSLVARLRYEMEQAEEQEREAEGARTRSQERISELRGGIREYRKALGLPEPSDMSGFEGADFNPDGMEPEAPPHSGDPAPSPSQQCKHGAGASNG